MKIACVVMGTRGDVQPMIALAKGLMLEGHAVTLCAPSEHEALARIHGVDFIPFGPEVRKSLSENPKKQKGGVAVRISPSEGKKMVLRQMQEIPDLIPDAELLLGAGIVVGVHSAADILKIPYRLVAFYPIILGTTPEDPLKSRMMFGFGRRVMNMMMKGYLNAARARFSLTPVNDIWEHWMGEKVILACDPEISPVRANVRYLNVQTGFMLLPSTSGLPREVQDFIRAGKAPVYIGFGSNPIADKDKYLRLIGEAARATRERLIVSKGWAGLDAVSSPDILYVDELPFDHLFPAMAAAIYHGGTGTMAAIARAGIPQAAFPFMGDQFDNRKQIQRLGLGPETCDFKRLDAESLARAIIDCLSNENYRKNARNLAILLQDSDGIGRTIRCLKADGLLSAAH